jgi:hypothetical protein
MTATMKRNTTSLARAKGHDRAWRLGWTTDQVRSSLQRASQDNRSSTPGIYAVLAGFHGR